MLQALAERLNHLVDLREIGEAITAELAQLIDYHNCRVYVLESDGETLMPIAFTGTLLEYQGETMDALLINVGEGLTGHAAATRTAYYTPNAMTDQFAVTIPGTPDVAESMLAVPMVFGDRLSGVVVLSKLGVDQFDTEDQLVLEVLASNAAVAMENAKLVQSERESARTSGELLKFSQALTRVRDVDDVLAETLNTIPAMMRSSGAQAYLRDGKDGPFRLIGGALPGLDAGEEEVPFEVPAEVAEKFLLSIEDPFVLTREMAAEVPAEYRRGEPVVDALVAPLRWEPDGFGALVIAAEGQKRFSDVDIEFARGIADITSLALGNAGRFQELRESAERLRALDEMKTTFLEAVSHDLRTPLASVLGISLTLGRDDIDLSESDTKDLVARLAANARKLEHLLADLLDLDRLARGILEPNRRPVDVAALVADIVENSEVLGGRNVVTELDSVVIAVDSAKVERIVENLLANTARHTPAKATIWVRVERWLAGALIAIEDEGPGIPDELKTVIFEPFRQGPQSTPHAPGVGIGLSLVARFAELHGGRAWVEDRDGGGSSFRVFLPDAPEEPDNAWARLDEAP
jgi:K+-sensing histidine kinase KdpD